MTATKHEAAFLEKQVADLRIALQLAREASKDLRRAGRAEALAILLAHGAENIGDFIGSHPIADSGDYGEHWDEPKLRELLDVAGDDPTLSLIDRMDGRYWDQIAEIDALRERIAGRPAAPALDASASAGGWGYWGSVTVPQPAQDPKSITLPREPLWDRKGNVIHAAVDRLGAAQRAAAAAAAGEPEDNSAEAPKP